jgi:hypothetical protein
MVIPETQSETWSHQGSVDAASATYESVRTALYAGTSVIKDENFEVFLHGSYKNNTNIRGDSDVDVVVQLNSIFEYDCSVLIEDEKRLFHQAYPSEPTYSWTAFRTDVLNSLRNHYQSSTVSEGNKSLKIAGGSSRLEADVIVCLQYRKYESFRASHGQKYVEGIVFYTKNENYRVISFPKVHYDNGTKKNNGTNGWYKPTVRMFKNARAFLVDQGIISQDLVPSYFLECLLFNVPDREFGGNYQTTFYNILNWISRADLSTFVSQDRQSLIFDSPFGSWSLDHAKRFIDSLITLWNER